ncbi:efflux RND transporter permease subunit [Chiayiivirga flava]|uniref:Efflux pump membrane transporter n=1 Tax=Chiayiivirga flava TaxID=659595 RepID=A0A7W8FZU5_9GAMM|nr:multidrug efflux RND transporter permease subunit [Chiayiivirga flava]MBB5207579.1 hydrophobe/amphiphile efflux-1 (HAE1) family protein [Chiayiivirga flava]
MFSAFFIRRPIFATVLSLIIVIMGLGAMIGLPISQYPEILPPQISVDAQYSGASAEVVADTIAAPIENQVNGATDMIYMNSSSNSDGRMSLTVTFATGTDPDDALVEVNNRIAAALPMLPEEVRRLGVTARKSMSSILGVAVLTAPDGRYDEVFLSNYALVNIVDELKRIPGVGDARLFGLKYYSMRIWMEPQRMQALGITPSEVAAALRDQNNQLPAGKIGQEPLDEAVDFTYSMTTKGRLETPEEFEQVIVRRDSHGGIVRLKDVARVELGGQSYSFSSQYNGNKAVPMGIFLQPGANALATMDMVKERMDALSAQFPDGLQYNLPYDTTKFVRISINEVVKTLFEAMLLVFAVVYLFLGNWRATLIPSLAVPVSLIGTFAGMYLLGFSINTLTLFGMVLAIGIVVDDAIVVLENVERIMHEEHLSPVDATLKAMQQVTGPVVAIVLVLCAVFVPVAFVGGMTGVMYQQFAITIAVSVAISGIVALTLTPALCALLLKSDDKAQFRWLQAFNRWFGRMTGRYTTGVTYLLRHGVLTLLLFGAVIIAAGGLFTRVPGSLVPNEDQGTVLALAMLPDAASMSRTTAVVEQLTEFQKDHPLVEGATTLIGFDMLSSSLKTNVATQFIALKDWSERTEEGQDSTAFAGQLMGFGMTQVRDAFVLGITPPPIIGLSTTGGFEFYIESRANADYRALAQVTTDFIAAANNDPDLTGVSTQFSANAPQIELEINRDKAAEMGVSLTQLFEATQSTFGTLYVNDFNRDGRTYQVQLQADGEARSSIEDLRNVSVRSDTGELVPLNTLVTPVQKTGPELVERFNSFPAIKVMGNPNAGVSSGAAIAAIERLAGEHLPEGYSVAWIGSAFQEKQVASTSYITMIGGLLFVFLILAAQYERWSLPFAVILSIPFALLGAVVAVLLRGLSNDIYFQVGLITLIGLSAKNAILIVEFAAENVRDGMKVVDAAILAAKQRFRPIVMTSLAFILGVLPLAISSGAGANARHSIGTGVIGGMIASTLIAVFFIPSLFRWVSRREEKREGKAAATSDNVIAPEHKA